MVNGSLIPLVKLFVLRPLQMRKIVSQNVDSFKHACNINSRSKMFHVHANGKTFWEKCPYNNVCIGLKDKCHVRFGWPDLFFTS